MTDTQGRTPSPAPVAKATPEDQINDAGTETLAPAGEGSDSGRSPKRVFEPIDVPQTRAGVIATKLLAAHRFQVLEQLQEPLTMFRVDAINGNGITLSEESLLNLEAAGRRAMTAAAIMPRGLPAALSKDMAELSRIGGHLLALSALLRRERVRSSAAETIQLRAKTADVAADLYGRIQRMQAGRPGEPAEFDTCRRQIQEKGTMALAAFALVERWLDSRRQDAVYSALGGEDALHQPGNRARAPQAGVSETTQQRAREVLGLGAGESFDEAFEAMVRETDALAPTVVACVSALDETPLVRCRESIDALLALARSAPAGRRQRRAAGFGQKQSKAAHQ